VQVEDLGLDPAMSMQFKQIGALFS